MLYYGGQIRRIKFGGGVLRFDCGEGEVLNVRRTRRIDVGKVNGCSDGGSESREASDGEKLQIRVRKADEF